MPLTGHLSDLSLSELIELFCNQRKTGQLKVLYPQGHGYFRIQSGSVVDAHIGVLRGIDAVYYSLTLPSAKFEFSGSSEAIVRTINQPWTQVVLEGLRRLDEGIMPPAAFPGEYPGDAEDAEYDAGQESENDECLADQEPRADHEEASVPSFHSSIGKESFARRRYLMGGAVAVAVLMSVAAIGVPAGWYGREAASAIMSQPSDTLVNLAASSSDATGATKTGPTAATDKAAVLAARRQREKERAAAREARMTMQNQPVNEAAVGTKPSTPGSSNPVSQSEKPGPKRVTVTVTYDESGRVTQASGGDASAVRIARQKRFPPGKAGSATITIPLN